jgi:hypothetical protein
MVTLQCWCRGGPHPWAPSGGCPDSGAVRWAACSGSHEECYCGAYEPHPHRWFPLDQGGRCPALYTSDPEQPQPYEKIAGGGHREGNGDRARPDLLWTRSQPLGRQMLHRDAVWAAYGAKKYGERNWEQFGTQEALDRCLASLGRHHELFMVGDTTEDHAAAIRTNVQYIEYIRERLAEPDPSQEGPF